MKIEKVAFISAELPYWNLVTHAVFRSTECRWWRPS